MKNLTRLLVLGIIVGLGGFIGTAHADVSKVALRKRLAKARKQRLKDLRTYWKTGKFPWGAEGVDSSGPIGKNDPHFDANHFRIHRFIAPNGNLCAVAYLMAVSGHRKTVDLIAKENNNICIAMKTDKEVRDWILTSGLTLEECIQIQRPGFRPQMTQQPSKEDALLAQVIPSEADQKKKLQALLKKVEKTIKKGTRKQLKVAVDRLLERPDLVSPG